MLLCHSSTLLEISVAGPNGQNRLKGTRKTPNLTTWGSQGNGIPSTGHQLSQEKMGKGLRNVREPENLLTLPSHLEWCSRRWELSLGPFLACYPTSTTPTAPPVRLPYKFSCFPNKMFTGLSWLSSKAEEGLVLARGRRRSWAGKTERKLIK